jgi:hypothetical protein
MISPRMSDQIFDLSILAEGVRQVTNYQPWPSISWLLPMRRRIGFSNNGATIETEGTLCSEERKDRKSLQPQSWEDQITTVSTTPLKSTGSQTTVEAMRLAEANLDAFWAAVDQNLRTGIDEGLQYTALWKLLSSERTLKRTPEWIEPEKISEKPPQNVDIESLVKPLSDIYFNLELRTERTVDRSSRVAHPAAKRKTKGTPASSAPTIPTPTDDEADTQPTFLLDNRSFKVFHTLFYTPSTGPTPGDVPWIDFFHMMVSTGFKPQKLYGSVWMFGPTGLDVERSIRFHEPHPSKKLAYRTARRFGRRPSRAYG